MFDKDHAAKIVFGNREAVANLLNEAFFQGRVFFLPENLHAMPTEEFILDSGDKGGGNQGSATWDALWRYDLGTDPVESLVIGMEFQSKVDYFMHGRLFVKAALNINAQHRVTDMERQVEGSRKGYASSEEFLSRFRKEDRIVKPLAVVVYLGDKEWDGPRRLNDIASPLPPDLAKFDYDFMVPVVELDKIPLENVLGFEQKLKLVLLYGRGRKDPALLKRILAKEPGFRKVPRCVAELIRALYNTQIAIPENQEEIDMCLAEELMIEEGREQGREEGRNQERLESAERYVQICRNANMPSQEILSMLQSVFLFPAQEAAALLNKA